MSSEKTEFYAPGTVTTWFRKVFRLPPVEAERAVVTLTPAERHAKLDERERELARWNRERAPLERSVASARERLAEARALLQEAEAVVAEAEREALAASMRHDLRIRQIETQVRAGASEQIAVFRRDVRDQLEALRAQGVQVHESWGRPNLATDRREHLVVSNAATVEQRRAALMAAYRAAEALETEPLDEAAVVERLTALRDSIPEAEASLAVEAADPLTPAERREIEWRATEQEARR